MKATFVLTMTDPETGVTGECVFDANVEWTKLNTVSYDKRRFRPSMLNDMMIIGDDWTTIYRPPGDSQPTLLDRFFRWLVGDPQPIEELLK